MKTNYVTMVVETVSFLLFAILCPIVVLFVVDRTIAAQDYNAGIEVKGCIFEINCKVDNFECNV